MTEMKFCLDEWTNDQTIWDFYQQGHQRVFVYETNLHLCVNAFEVLDIMTVTILRERENLQSSFTYQAYTQFDTLRVCVCAVKQLQGHGHLTNYWSVDDTACYVCVISFFLYAMIHCWPICFLWSYKATKADLPNISQNQNMALYCMIFKNETGIRDVQRTNLLY